MGQIGPRFHLHCAARILRTFRMYWDHYGTIMIKVLLPFAGSTYDSRNLLPQHPE